MLILPIVNKNRVLNVRITLNSAYKVRTGVDISKISESDIIVNGRLFSKSFYNEGYSCIVDFIRTNLCLYSKKFLITTKRGINSECCDIYEVDLPPTKINDAFDSLYGRVLVDMQKEIPGVIKSKYLSLKKIGFDKIFSDENISKIRKAVSNGYSKNDFINIFSENELIEALKIVEALNIFNCTVVSGASIFESSLVEMIDSFDRINSKDTKGLNNYYNMALENRDIYAKMAYVYKVVYGKDFNLIQSLSQKRKRDIQLVKVASGELSQIA